MSPAPSALTQIDTVWVRANATFATTSTTRIKPGFGLGTELMAHSLLGKNQVLAPLSLASSKDDAPMRDERALADVGLGRPVNHQNLLAMHRRLPSGTRGRGGDVLPRARWPGKTASDSFGRPCAAEGCSSTQPFFIRIIEPAAAQGGLSFGSSGTDKRVGLEAEFQERDWMTRRMRSTMFARSDSLAIRGGERATVSPLTRTTMSSSEKARWMIS
jgi:hypothetical protein